MIIRAVSSERSNRALCIRALRLGLLVNGMEKLFEVGGRFYPAC